MSYLYLLKKSVMVMLNLLLTGQKDKRNSLSGTVVYKSSQTHSVVCQPGGQAVMTGLVTQWLLIAATTAIR